MRILYLILFSACSILSWGQTESNRLVPPPRFNIYKPVNIQIKTLKDIKHLIIDSLENPKVYVLKQYGESYPANDDRYTRYRVDEWFIALERNQQYYVFNPFEKSEVLNGDIHNIQLYHVALTKKGSNLFALRWQAGGGETRLGTDFGQDGAQLWDFNGMTRQMDFVRSCYANYSDFPQCNDYQCEYSENEMRLIPIKNPVGPSGRRKANDTTTCYTYQFKASELKQVKVEPFIFRADPVFVAPDPLFLRIITCNYNGAGWFDDKSTIGFWYLSSDLIVPKGVSELVIHKSGKTLMLCEGVYSIADLNKLLHTDRMLISSCKDEIIVYDQPCRYYSPYYRYRESPIVFLNWRNYVYSKDTITIYTTGKRNYQVIQSSLFEDDVQTYIVDDNKIRLNMGLLKANPLIKLQITIPDARPKWSHDYIFDPLPKNDLKNFETTLKEYNEKMEGASEDFKIISTAYLFMKCSLLVEAHMLLRELYEKDKSNQFNKATYFSFLRLNYKFVDFEK